MGKLTPTYIEPKPTQKTFCPSSNSARDNLAKKAPNEVICLGKEPDVIPSQNLTLMKKFTNSIDRRMKQVTPALPDLEVVKPTYKSDKYPLHQQFQVENAPKKVRKCPDPTLYEDIVEYHDNKHAQHSSGKTVKESENAIHSSSPEPDENIKTPFQNVQNCLFSLFTAMMPWCLMRKVYWKRDKRSEALYEKTARMNLKKKRLG